MKTGKIELNGQTHLLCFSARTIRACGERYGNFEAVGDALDGEDVVKSFDEAIWLLAAMMDAGARYAAKNGLENPAPLTCDDIYDTCDLGDLTKIKGSIAQTVAGGTERKVEIEPEKNGEATLGR